MFFFHAASFGYRKILFVLMSRCGNMMINLEQKRRSSNKRTVQSSRSLCSG
jgi:hypothetical protein